MLHLEAASKGCSSPVCDIHTRRGPEHPALKPSLVPYQPAIYQRAREHDRKPSTYGLPNSSKQPQFLGTLSITHVIDACSSDHAPLQVQLTPTTNHNPKTLKHGSRYCKQTDTMNKRTNGMTSASHRIASKKTILTKRKRHVSTPVSTLGPARSAMYLGRGNLLMEARLPIPASFSEVWGASRVPDRAVCS